MSLSVIPRMRIAATLLPVATIAVAACGGGSSADRSARGGLSPAIIFGAVDSLSSPAAPGSAEPNLGVGPEGVVYLSWIEPAEDGRYALRFASLEDAAWSTPRTVAEGDDMFVNWADFPSLLPMGEGRLAAHWLQRGEARGSYGVRLVQSTDGGVSWSKPVTPHRDDSPTEHGFVSLWPSGDSLAAVWLDGRGYAPGSGGEHSPGNEMTLVSTTVASDGGLGAEQLLDARTCDCCQTAAALTARGPLVVYRDRSPDEIRDIAAVRLVDGRWTEPAHVAEDGWEIAACPVNGPAVAARGDTAVVAWFTGARDTARVQVARSTDGGASWHAPVRVDGGSPVGRVDVLLLGDGSALVFWLERTGGEEAELRLRRVRADGATEAPITVARSDAARSSGFPRLAASGAWVYMAWTQPGAPSGIRVARMSATSIGGGE